LISFYITVYYPWTYPDLNGLVVVDEENADDFGLRVDQGSNVGVYDLNVEP
jgi:hypothetical protein